VSAADPRYARPIPALARPAGWQDITIDPVDEPLVPVADIGGRVIEDPQYFAWGLPGALPGCWLRQGVADRLSAAAGSLPDGLMLLVWDGWPPQNGQPNSGLSSRCTRTAAPFFRSGFALDFIVPFRSTVAAGGSR
jgi:hypothetical protein